MTCDCEATGGPGNQRIVRVCDTHKAFTDDCTREASREIWAGAVRMFSEAEEEISDLISDRHRERVLLGARMYRDCLERRTKSRTS